MSASLFPFAPQQWFGDIVPNASGKIWLYERGTTTPASGSIWWDANGTVAGANPIILDGAGRPTPTGAVYLSIGAYTVVMLDSANVQVGDPVDIIVSGTSWGGGEAVNTGTAIIVKTYSDVRNLTQAWDAVYVCGRSAEGDGGQGWFQLDPLETGVDDDGVCLVAGSNRYVRVLDDSIDPRWYGLKYSATADQTTYFVTANAASTRWNRPTTYEGSTTLLQDTVVLHNQSIKVIGSGVFVSGAATPVNMRFQGDCEFSAEGITFGIDVQPLFAKDLIPKVPLSWMGGATNEERLDRWINCADAGYDNTHQVLLLDASFVVGTMPAISGTYSVDAADGMLTFESHNNIDMDLVYDGDAQIFKFTDAAHIGTINIGNRPAKPEWFGATGVNALTDSIGIVAAETSGVVKLSGKKTYHQALRVTPANLEIIGDLPNALATTQGTVPEPKIALSRMGSFWHFTPTNPGSDTLELFPWANAAGIEGEQVVDVAYWDGHNIVVTSLGFMYRIDQSGSTYTAVKLTSTERTYTQLFERSGVKYAVALNTLDRATTLFSLSFSGDVCTETPIGSTTPNYDGWRKVALGSTYVYAVTFSNDLVEINLGTGGVTTIASNIDSRMTRSLACIGDTAYVLSTPATLGGTGESKIISVTHSGTQTAVGTFGSDVVMDICILGGAIYAVKTTGNILKMTTGGVISVTTTGSESTNWVRIYERNGEIIAADTSFAATNFAIEFSGAGLLNVRSAGLDGTRAGLAMNSQSASFIDTQDGIAALSNAVVYRLNIPCAQAEAHDSMIEGLTFSGVDDAVITLSNVLMHDTDRQHFQNNSTFRDLYFETNKNDSATFDAVVTTDSDGLVGVKHSLLLDQLEARNSFKFGALFGFDTSAIKYVDLAALGSYTVQANDPPIIVCSPGTADRTVTLNAAAASTGCKIRIFICNYTTYDAQLGFTGDLIGDAAALRTPGLSYQSYVRLAVFCDTLGKWAL